MIGKSNRQRAEPPQFSMVEYGKKLAQTIYGIYIQTIGPSDSPKLAIKQNNPIKIKNSENDGDKELMKNPTDIMKVVTIAPIVPN